MNYKLIAMDFDGTLLTTDKKISSYTQNTLLDFKNKGYIIVGVTARNLDSVKNVLDINMFDYLILNNGGYVYDIKNNKGEYKEIISKEDYSNITKDLEIYNAGFDFCSATSYYSYKHKPVMQRPFIKNIENVEEIEEKIARMNVFISDQDKLENVCNFINDKYKKFNCFIMQDSDSDSDSKWLVINPKGINKSNTLKQLGQNLKIELKEMIFFGDGPNDIDIMQVVGYSVAMGNAFDQIKDKASAITLSNNEDGIAIFLEDFLK